MLEHPSMKFFLKGSPDMCQSFVKKNETRTHHRGREIRAQSCITVVNVTLSTEKRLRLI